MVRFDGAHLPVFTRPTRLQGALPTQVPLPQPPLPTCYLNTTKAIHSKLFVCQPHPHLFSFCHPLRPLFLLVLNNYKPSDRQLHHVFLCVFSGTGCLIQQRPAECIYRYSPDLLSASAAGLCSSHRSSCRLPCLQGSTDQL